MFEKRPVRLTCCVSEKTYQNIEGYVSCLETHFSDISDEEMMHQVDIIEQEIINKNCELPSASKDLVNTNQQNIIFEEYDEFMELIESVEANHVIESESRGMFN